jgi:ubiquinone biosynthesis protein
MAISLKSEHLKRYKDIGRLFVKYGRTDLMAGSGLDDLIERDRGVTSATPEANEFARDLEDLGPTFVKLGQLLSTRADLLPGPYLEALTRLQDDVEGIPFELIREIVETELGMKISRAFLEFEEVPIAAASLGQVHRAKLRDGRPVAVKVQRPGVRQDIVDDLDALSQVAEFVDGHTEFGRRYEFAVMLEELRKSLVRELDYREEASSLEILGANLADFERVIVPSPIDGFCTSRVLTMDYIRGRKITSLGPLVRLELDGRALCEQIFGCYLKQMLVDGFFHADPHPGNVFLTDDGDIALLDVGMTARISSEIQDQFLRLLIAVSEGRGEEAADHAYAMGDAKDNFDRGMFRRHIADVVAEFQNRRIERLNVGSIVLEITRVAAESDFRLPREFTMVAKTLLNLDKVVKTLDRTFDPNDYIRRQASAILQQKLLQSLSPGSLVSTLLEAKEFAGKLPSRVNKILESLANNELKITVDAIDETTLMEGAQKVANRITVGLVLAALIIGASNLMSVQTSFTILGYPGLAIILFMLAAIGGVALMVNILWTDEHGKK